MVSSKWQEQVYPLFREEISLDANQIVRIFDTTLRDGEQTPGVSITPTQKLEIAIKLDELGVDVIEAGFPVVSEGEIIAIKNIVKQRLKSEICVLARTVKSDIDAAINCGVDYVHTFIATSEIHMKHKLKMSKEQVLERAVWAVQYAKDHGMRVEFSAEDATRSDRKFLLQVFKSVSDVHVDRIDIPDTVGYATPPYIESLVNDIIEITKVPISMHCHDDFGLAVANSVAGINAGATCAHVTINGLGERAGNASLEELVMALQCLYGKKHNINTQLLYEVSKFVSNTMGIIVQPNKAIIGENAFGHESGIHTHGIINNPLTYEPISPELVGRRRWLQAGKHAGAHGIRAMLGDFGIDPTDEQLHTIVEKQKDIADLGNTITTSELLSIAGEVLNSNQFEEKFKLLDFHIVTGMNMTPTAVVRLVTHGKNFIASEVGVGPVDAALKAIQKIAAEIANIRIREYRLDSITGGSDALAEVSVKVEDLEGNVISSRRSGSDVVVASVQALMDAINKTMLRKILKPKNRQF
jgi:2-isopropylmalate synthase